MKELKEFFSKRPALSVSGVSREAGISSAWLYKLMNGDALISETVQNNLFPVLNKYGGNFDTSKMY